MTLWFPTLPGPLEYIQDFIVGHWPEGDEDAMRRAAGHWSDMAEKLKGLQEPADQAMNSALSAIDGQIHDAMSSYWKDIGGNDGELKALIDACDSFAHQLEQGATDIEHTKISIYISVGIMVAMLLWSWVPGVGQAEEAGTIIAGKAAIQAAFRKLLSKLGVDAAKFMEKRGAKLLVNAGVGSTLGAGTDLAAQGIQVAEGTRKNMDWKSVGLSTLSGAIAGTVAGPVGEKLGEGIGANFTSNAGKALSAKGGEVVGNVVGNAVAGTTSSVVTGQHVDLAGVWEGGGGGLGNKGGVHPNADVGTHETTTTTIEPASNPSAQPNSEPSHASNAPGAASTAPASVAHPDVPSTPGESTTPASTSTASASTADTSTTSGPSTGAGNENSAAPQQGSAKSGSGIDAQQSTPDPQPAATNGAPSGTDRSITGQPGAVPDRSTVPPSGSPSPGASSVPSPASAAPANAPRAAVDTPPRADGTPRADTAAAPESSSTASPRTSEAPRGGETASPPSESRSSPGSDGPRRGEGTAPTDRTSVDTGSRPDDSRPVEPTGTPPGAREGAAQEPRPTPGPDRPRDLPSQPEETSRPRPVDARTPAAARESSGPRVSESNVAEPKRPASPGPETPGRTPPPADSPARATEKDGRTPPTEPGRSEPGPAPDQQRQPVRTEQPAPDQLAPRATGGPGSEPPSVAAVVVEVPPRTDEPRGGTPATVEHRAESPNPIPNDHPRHEDATPAPEAYAFTGGAIRPRDPLDIAAQDKWANDAYDAIRHSDNDVRDMVDNLSDSVRSDGSVGFSELEISQVKQHVFATDHKLSIFDDSGQVVGYEYRRFDADPDIAEAWMRLSRGEPLHADVTLLDHELAESDYLRTHPDASYREAHAFANSKANWERNIPERTGENYERWSGEDGPVHGVPEGGGIRDRGDVRLREQRDGNGSRIGDPEGQFGRQSGGRYDRRPVTDEGGSPDPGAEGNRPDLAGRRRDPGLTESWEPHGGATDLLRPDPQRPKRGAVLDRDEDGPPRSGRDDRQDEQRRSHGSTGGRDIPVGGGADRAPGRAGEGEAPQRSDRLLADIPPEPQGHWVTKSSLDAADPGSSLTLPSDPVHGAPEFDHNPGPTTPAREPVDVDKSSDVAATQDRMPKRNEGHVPSADDRSSTPVQQPQSDNRIPHTTQTPTDNPDHPRLDNGEHPSAQPHPEPMVLTEHDRKLIDTFASKQGLSTDDVIRGIENGDFRLGDYFVLDERPLDLVQTPDDLDPRYLTEAVEHKLKNPLEPRNYASVEPDAFRPGCHDHELPTHLTRSMPDLALEHSATSIDPDKIMVTETRPDLDPMWRDLTNNDAYLDAKHALFRMDSRGPEIFGSGFQPRNPRVLDISVHVGDAHSDGFVSLSKSPERTIARETRAHQGSSKQMPDGTFRQTMYMHELYTPHGIDVDATFHDAKARSRHQSGTHKEAEVLAPGGISGEAVYRLWPREIVFDSSGKPVSVTVGEPIYNPHFAHRDNPRFGATHDSDSRLDSDRSGGDGAGTNMSAPGPDEESRVLHPTERNSPRPDAPQFSSDQPVRPEHPQAQSHPDLSQPPEAATPYRPESPRFDRASLGLPDDRAPESNRPESTPLPAPTHGTISPSDRPESNFRAQYDRRETVAPVPDQQPHWMQGASDSEAPRNFSQAPEVPRNDPHHTPDPGPHGPYASQDADRRQSAPSTPQYNEPRQSDDRGAAVERETPTRQDPYRPGPEQIPPRENSVPGPRHDSQQDLTQAPEPSPPPRRVDASESAQAHGNPRAQRGSGDPSYVERQDPARTSGPEQSGPQRVPRLSRPEDGPPHGPSREDLTAAYKARQSREWFRQWRPEGDRVTPVTSKVGPNAKPSFDFRRYPRAEGGPIAVARIKVHVTTDGRVHPDRVGQVWERAQLATDLEFNRAQRLLSGDRLLVDLEYTHNPAEANLHINVSENRGPWHPDMSPGDIARQLRDHVGLLPSDPNHPGLSPTEIRQLSNDVAHANTPTPFDNPSELRTNGPQRLNDVERPEYQAAVEDALRDGNRFLVGADPRNNDYGRLINDGGVGVSGRRNNCLDCSLSALSAFQGHPQVSAPRWPDRLPDGTIDNKGGERGGVQRAAQWIGDGLHQFTDGRPLPAQFAGLHDIVERMGPGSSALVVNEWHARDQVTGQLLYNADGTPVRDGSHATVIVYPHGASGPVWWDPQAGTMSPHPPPGMAHGSTGLWFTPIPSPHQGGIHGGIPHPGPSRGVPSADLQSRPTVSAVPVRGRVAGPVDPDPAGERSGRGVGDDQPGDRLGNRRGDRIPELERDDDRGGLPGGQTDRPGAERRADLSTPVASERSAHSGDAGDDQLSRPGAVSGDSTRGGHEVRDDNRQEHAEVPATRTGLCGPDRLGGVAEPRERGLAGTTDLGRVETQGPTGPAAANHDIAASIDDPAANPQRDGGSADGNRPPEPGARPDTPDGHGGDESAARQDAERYVSQNHVAEALDRAGERGVVAKSGEPIGEAVRSELPQHPELVQLMQNAPYLEHSLLERPQTLHALVTKPDAIPFLSDAVHAVAERGPEAVLADPVQIEPTPLTPEQQAISRELQNSLRRVEPADQRQPGFDRIRRLDPLYQWEFLQHQYDIWESTQGELNRIVSDIAGRTNGKAGWRKQPKDPERARAKIKKYQGDVSRLTDLVGAKIEFDKIDDAYRALDLISADPRIEVVSFDDRFANPTPSGYRDLQMKVRMPNGHIAEFRLHLSHIDKFVDTEHALFEVRRDFESLAEDEHRDVLRPEEKALRSEIDRQTNQIFWEATKKGLPEEFPPDPEHGPEDPGPEPDGPTPRSGPDGPPPKPAPDSHGVDRESTGEADLRQLDTQYTDSDVPDNASSVRNPAEIEREANAAVDRSVDRRIAYLKDDAGAQRFAPKAGRGIRSLLHSEFERLESSRRGLKDMLARMTSEPGFDPAVVDAWRSDRPKLAIDIADESGKASRMVLIDRGPGRGPLLVPTGSSEHLVAVIERVAGEEGADPVQLYQQHRFAVDDSTRDFGRISVGSPEDAMRIGTRIMRDLPLVEELRTELHSELAESASRHLDRVPERTDSYFSERGFKPGKRETREYERKLTEEIRSNEQELLDTIDKLTKIGFDPHVYSAWRQARAGVTIEIKPDANRAVFTSAPPPRFRLVDLGGDRKPQLLPVGTPEHLLARIGELAEEGRDPAAILSALCARDNEKVDFTAHGTDQQTLDLAREALLERRIAADLDSRAKSGDLGSEVNEIRHRVGAELDRATTRWLSQFRSVGIPEMPGGVRANELDTQHALVRLRSRATAAIRGGIDPEIYRLWSQSSPAIGVRSRGADSGDLVSLHDPTAEGGRRLLPARSGERELALIERELRDGTYPPDAARRLDALAETADAAPVIGRHAAEQSGSDVVEIEEINRHLQSALDESIARAVHFEPKIPDQNQRLTDQAADAVRRERQQAIEVAARDLRERISDRIGAGIDPAVYRAWQQARDGVPVTVRSGDHVERMTLLDLGPDREPLLVSSKSPEWELHRIEQMSHTGESLFAVHRELIGEDSEKFPPAIYRPFSEEDSDRQLYADSADQAVSIGREVLAQKQETREEITAMQQRSLDAARHSMASGELTPTEFAQRERQIRSDTQTLRDMADHLFARGIDPKVINEVRAVYDGKAEGVVSHRATPSGPPSVVVTIEREPHVQETGHDDQEMQHDRGRQQAAREEQLSLLRAETERRERVLLEQQNQARQREHELIDQRERAAAQEKERAEKRDRERREAQQRHQARQAEIARIRAAREKAQHEFAQVREGRSPEPRPQSASRAPEHPAAHEVERGIARGPEHGPVRGPERPSSREFDPPVMREPERGGAREPDRLPVREPEQGQTRGIERDRADALERHIMELADQEYKLVLEHQRDVGFEEVLDVQRQHERALFDPQQIARQQELVSVREAISAHELELAQTRERLLEVGDELSRGREHQARTPVLEKQRVPVRGLPASPVREPMVVEWKSPERQLGQLITLVKQVDAPTLAMKEVITPAKVRELLEQELDCPAKYLERLARSPENLRWLARQREEQERMRSRARETEANARAMVRTRD